MTACYRQGPVGLPDGDAGRMIMTNRTFRICSLLAAILLLTPAASAQLVGPSAPGDLTASATAPGEITLTWTPARSLLGVTAYRVYHVDADGNLTHVVDVPGDQLRMSEGGLAPGRTMTYVVSAFDPVGEGPVSQAASATTWSTPSAPTLLGVASGPGIAGEATVSWAAPGSDGGSAVVAYQVYRDGTLVATLDAATFSLTEIGLSPLQAYTYAVTASNLVGEGAASDPHCGMASPWTPELGCTSVL